MVQNSCSPFSNLGNGMEAEFGERKLMKKNRVVLMMIRRKRLMDSVGEVQTDFGLHILSWETSRVDDNGSGIEEKDNCVLECKPLSQWEPNDLSEGLLVQDIVEGS